MVSASHCSGFSCYRGWALGTWASVTVSHGLSSAGKVVVVPDPDIEPASLSPTLAGVLTLAPPEEPLVYREGKRENGYTEET